MILLTGSTGFTGRFVSKTLLQRNISFRCLVRDPQKAQWLLERNVPIIVGDVRDKAALRQSLEDCEGVINLVSFKEQHIGLLIEQACKARIRRSVFIGTTAIFTSLNAQSKALRQSVEKDISTSKLDWTLLRPTMIYGAKGDRNMERLIKAIARFSILPILGKGDKLIQPIHVTDLAAAIVDAYNCTAASRKAFNVSGKDSLTYRQAVGDVAGLMGRKLMMIPLPLSFAVLAVNVARRIPGLPRLNTEQVHRLNEDKAFDHQDATAAWGFNPMRFTDGIRLELADLGITFHQP